MPAVNAQPYINFNGRAEEALDLYKRVLAAEVRLLMRCKDAPGPTPTPGLENKILHSEVQIGSSTLFITDGRNTNTIEFKGVSISVEASNEAEAKRIFDGLADGGTVTMALAPSFFAKSFGMLTDRFGLEWLVIVPAPTPG